MTRDEAIKAIDANWPTENYARLREALTLAKDALRSRPAPSDDLVRAVEAVLDHDDQHDTLHGTGLAEMLRAALAAPAPVAAPVPRKLTGDETEYLMLMGVSNDGTLALGEGAADRVLNIAKRLVSAAPVPETPAKCNGQGIECPGCSACETPAPDAMPCPECLGMPCAACNGTGRRQEAQP